MTTATKAAPRQAGNQPSAQPGTKEPKAKKEKEKKAKRIEFPGLVAEENGEKTRKQLKEWPADFDPKAHKPLRRGDFENESVFLIHRADEFEARAKAYRTEAEAVSKLGSAQDRAKTKRLAAMQKKIEDLKKQLADQGVDVEAMMAAMAATAE